jgi:hypothetical protein
LRDRLKHWRLEWSKLIKRVMRQNMLKVLRIKKIMNLWGILVALGASKVSKA